MIRNYFKIAFRNIKRYAAHSILNIMGMAIGMACAILILLWVYDEWSYDRHFDNADNLYRIIGHMGDNNGESSLSATTLAPLSKVLKEEYPEIIRSSRCGIGSIISFKIGDEFIDETAVPVDNDFLQMFNVEFIKGDMNNALNAPNNMVLTEKIAKKYFGNESPIGKTLKYTANNEIYTITGVVKNPHHTHLMYDILIPIKFDKKFESLKSDMQMVLYNYIELKKGTDSKLLNEKIRNYLKDHSSRMVYEISLQNIKKIHLYSSGKYKSDIKGLGDITYVLIMGIIAVFILLIACINFMNLATAQSAKRAKEIGVRKMAGANKRNIIFQFLGETLLILFVAHVIAMILVELMLPGFNNLTGKQLAVNYQSAYLYLGLIAIVLFCGLLAGSYPALYLSSLKPLDTMKGIIYKNPGNAKFRRVLVIFQFSISAMLIICTLVIGKQLNFMQNINLGFNKDNVGYFMVYTRKEDPRLESLKNELSINPDIISITTGLNLNGMDGNVGHMGSFRWKGKKDDNDVTFCTASIDTDYAKTLQLELTMGRFFSSEFSTDSNAVVINEAAAKFLGFDDPIGQVLSTEFAYRPKIIGVVKDFHFTSMHHKIEPILLTLGANRCFLLKIKPDKIASTTKFVKQVFESYNFPNQLIFNFIDDDLKTLYRTEQGMGKIFGCFSFLAIIISCLGLIGLSTFMTERRTKEIGIRKANGAKFTEILSLLLQEYILWVLISIIITGPIAYYVMSKWLQNFAYRINISWWEFTLTFAISLFIALLTVTIQSYRAARKNPVEALRYE
jgi:ABC-type antimicrobial peptide transport system permease subunit